MGTSNNSVIIGMTLMEPLIIRLFYKINFAKAYLLEVPLYNRLLKCYVLVDLKIGKINHQDLGQMQMYVNYFDRYEKKDFENPTIGILLCQEKNDSLIELTLPENANIYVSENKLYLPDKKVLQEKLKEWVNEIENNNGSCVVKPNFLC